MLVVRVLVADHALGVVVAGILVQELVHPLEQGDIPVEQDLIKTLPGPFDPKVLKVHEALPASGEP